MLKKRLISTIASCLLMALVLVNILLMLGNQSLQNEVGERQQAIGQAMQLETLHRQVITVLAEMAVKTDDAQLKELLAASGFNVSPMPGLRPSSK